MENWLKISDELYVRRIDSGLGVRVYTLRKTGNRDVKCAGYWKNAVTEPARAIIEYEWELRGVLISDETTILTTKGKDEEVFRLVNSKIDKMTKEIYF